MSINATLCHSEAVSLVGLESASEYLAGHPDYATWMDLGGEDEEAKADLGERFLVAASRMICRAPLAFGPLADDFGWEEQGLCIPTAGHPVLFGAVDDCGEKSFRDASLTGLPKRCVVSGSVRLAGGEIISVTGFDASTGTVTLVSAPVGEFRRGTSFALIEALPLPVVHAVCEQAIYLAGGPNLSALDRGEQGIRITTATGIGGGSVTSEAATAAGELCFAARRLLKAAGLLCAGRNPSSGRA